MIHKTVAMARHSGTMKTEAHILVERISATRPPLNIAVVTETYPPDINGVAHTLSKIVDGLQARGHVIWLVRPRQHAALDVPPLADQVVGRIAVADALDVEAARGEQGEIAIRFGSLDELNGLLEKLSQRMTDAERATLKTK
mgnify:CR=1 FL=1